MPHKHRRVMQTAVNSGVRNASLKNSIPVTALLAHPTASIRGRSNIPTLTTIPETTLPVALPRRPPKPRPRKPPLMPRYPVQYFPGGRPPFPVPVPLRLPRGIMPPQVLLRGAQMPMRRY